ncbi:MAG: insulinase family protein [Clostridia bacterium]|nr:insulinase family protein [Clostridia bacterium]
MSFEIFENKQIDEKYYYKKHKSGLDVYVIPKNHGTSYAVFGTKFGSIDNHFRLNGEEITVPDGIAHFLEHKMFENEDGVDTFKKYAKYGASANAYTSSDITVYLFSATANMTENLEILLDFVSHPYFTKETVDKEQGIIGQEIRMYDDNPNWRLYFNMLRAMYKNHPVNIDTAGTVETIAEITAETLHKTYATFYNLHNMALCVCGNINPEDIDKVCDKILKEAPKLSVDRIYPDEPKEVNLPEICEKMQVSMPMFSVGIKDPVQYESGKALAKKSAEMSILLRIIFGRASDFYSRLYESGLINSSFSAAFDAHSAFSYTEISGLAKDPDIVYEEIKKEIERYREKGINAEEFERAKRALYAGSVRTFDSTDDIANSFLAYLFCGCNLLSEASVIADVTLEDVNTRLKHAFPDSAFAISKILPLD